MITQFRLEDFKAHRDTTLALKQLTLLVGDNGSGKTSVLEAIRLPGQLATAEDRDLYDLMRRGAKHMTLSFDGSTGGPHWATSIALEAPEDIAVTGSDYRDWNVKLSGVDALSNFEVADVISRNWPLQSPTTDALRRATNLLGGVGLYRFRSDQVAASAYSDEPGAVVAEDGAQTAVALAALKLADDDAFNRIEDSMRKLVPSVRRMLIRPTELLHRSNPNPVVGHKLYFDFQGAKNVPAHHASQGSLVLLALLTVLHSQYRPSVILLDDFDHSLHPRAQMELVRMIKELLALEEFRETQIIATTHSPYVLDEVEPSNVIAFALRDDGTVAAKPLSEHPDAPKVNGSLKAGELWTLDAERDWVL